MSSAKPKAKSSRRVMVHGMRNLKQAAACVAVALVGLGATHALAVTFYKWTDSGGLVHYGDAPPKGFDGKVTRVEIDPGAHTVAPAPLIKPAPQTAIEPEPTPAAPDLLTQRRETRARLEQNLAQARERLDLARKALAEATDPQPDEWQFVAGTGQAPSGPQVARSNCHPVQGGKVVCPTRVPNEQYYQRLDQLQAEVELAQKAVDDAEVAYRRGVD